MAFSRLGLSGALGAGAVLILSACAARPGTDQVVQPQSEQATGERPTREAEAARSWALASTALLFERNGQSHELLGGDPRTPEAIAHWTHVLARDWGIDNRKDLLGTLHRLSSAGHRESFNRYRATIRQMGYREAAEAFAGDEQVLEKLARVEALTENLGPTGILAWDSLRYISLARWGYLVGYLSEDEAWKQVGVAAKSTQAGFDSWKQMGESYLAGLAYWRPEGSQETDATFDPISRWLLTSAESPWQRVPWSTPLAPAGW